MTNEHNAWPIIAKCMEQRKCRQKDLAAALNITSSAISQIKRGMFLLDADQLRKVVGFLRMSTEDSKDLYLMLFRARLQGSSKDISTNRPTLQPIRIVGLSNMAFFEPLLISLGEWLEKLSSQLVYIDSPESECFAVYLPDSRLGLAAETVLILKADRVVKNHDMALAQQQNGLLCLGYCTIKNDGGFVFDDLTGCSTGCLRIELSKHFKWILPVRNAIWPASTLIRKMNIHKI